MKKVAMWGVVGVVMLAGAFVRGQSIIIRGSQFNNTKVTSTSATFKNGNGWTYIGGTFRKYYGPKNFHAIEWIVSWGRSTGYARAKGKFEKGESTKYFKSNRIVIFRHYIRYVYYRYKNTKTSKITTVYTRIIARGPKPPYPAARISWSGGTLPISANVVVRRDIVGLITPSVKSFYFDNASKDGVLIP